MRRDFRNRNNRDSGLNEKIIKYTGIGVAILAVIVFLLLLYSRNLNNEVKDSTLSKEQISSILNNASTQENTQSASSEIGKSINEVKNETNSTANQNKSSNSNSTNNILNTNNVTSKSTTNANKEKNETTSSSNTTNTTVENKTSNTSIELQFSKPVDGDVVRDFAFDSLIFSETLQEWTTHTGVDIKADKTTVVKSAEAGTVKSIKNDPRYGMTVVVEHANGFRTVYSNLLTSEFVVEGEKVEKGQSIGTVGNTAAFEIADEPHLHFEILKDNVAVDPNIYLK